MSKNLVIVESPAKAKTINKYLGKEYIVKSSVGHIRDLPTSGDQNNATEEESPKTPTKRVKLSESEKEQRNHHNLIRRLAVDPDNNWTANYQILPGKEKVLKELKEQAIKSDTIYLATDLDREGEAIAWHLQEALGGDPKKYRRVTFSEITKKAIDEAFKKPTKVNLNKVNAQQARRFLDRVVGYMVSPLLWKKVGRGLSAGRVQSVAVRLITEREKEIKAFIPEEYWEASAVLSAGQEFPAKVTKIKGETFRPKNQSEAEKAVKYLKESGYLLSKREEKAMTSKPSAPFITSTLQQAASQRLGFGVKKTMTLAQRLYEAGHITYMRTDSTHIGEESLTAARSYIENQFGKKYLPEKPIVYTNKENAQEAHEAIRPSDVYATVELLQTDGALEPDQVKLYELIWRRFVACQMSSAEFDTTSYTITAGDYELKSNGRVMKFDGYRKVLPATTKKDDETELPDVKQGTKLNLINVSGDQHFTKPPARYTEAKLVQELEKRGIGRPSTYASIISTIQDRGYVKVEARRFFALKMGEVVTERLVGSFHDLMDYEFTAKMEARLDKVAQGEADWIKVLNTFYKDFKENLSTAEESMIDSEPTPTDIKCPTCGRPLMIRTATTGVFLSCSGYALPPKERCKGTINLVPGYEAVAVTDDLNDDEGDERELLEKKRCTICSTSMDSYLMDETHKLHVCGNNPSCPGYILEEGKFKIKGYDGPTLECDKCGSQMQLKTGRFGKYFGCTKYPECNNTRKLLRSGEAAPPKADAIHMPELKCSQTDGYFILRDGAAGMFLASSNFPKSRETRKPELSDLLRHKSELDEKFNFLLKGPVKDPDGHPYLVKFARKTKEYFLSSETKDGKPTGRSAFFDGSKWLESTGVPEKDTDDQLKNTSLNNGSKIAAPKVTATKDKAKKRVKV
jgi:DNA topoisomerase-1